MDPVQIDTLIYRLRFWVVTCTSWVHILSPIQEFFEALRSWRRELCIDSVYVIQPIEVWPAWTVLWHGASVSIVSSSFHWFSLDICKGLDWLVSISSVHTTWALSLRTYWQHLSLSIWASDWCFSRCQEYSCYSKGNSINHDQRIISFIIASVARTLRADLLRFS